MSPTTDELLLFPDHAGPPDGVVVFNDRCRFQERDGYRVVRVSGLPLAHFAAGDRVGEAHAMASLVELGWVLQREVARAFGCHVRTVRRHQRRFEEGGLAALGRPRGFPWGRPRVTQSRRDAVNRRKSEGVSNREIARRLGIDEKAVRKLARRLGWQQERWAEQRSMPFEGADPKTVRSGDRPGAGPLLAGPRPGRSLGRPAAGAAGAARGRGAVPPAWRTFPALHSVLASHPFPDLLSWAIRRRSRGS